MAALLQRLRAEGVKFTDEGGVQKAMSRGGRGRKLTLGVLIYLKG